MQVSLSSDLVEITAEINTWKQQAGQAVFEIGKRLKHVKEIDLVHGQWGSWLESLDISPRTAQAMIQAYEQFGNTQTSAYLGSGKIFEMLTLPESIDRQQFIEKPHVIPSSGESKQVDEMTVKELREVKKALQESEKRAAQAESVAKAEMNRANHAEKLWQQAKNQPVQVRTETKTVVPQDYDDLKRQAIIAQQLNGENVQLKRANEEMRQKHEEQLSSQQKSEAAKKNLQKYLSEHLRSLTMNHDSAIFNFADIQGDREAHNTVMRFLEQYESIVKQQFADWEQLTTLRAVK